MTALARHYTCIIRTKTYLVAAGYTIACLPTAASVCNRLGSQDLVEDRRNVATKLFGIFTHRKMAELLHDGDTGAPDSGSGPFSIFRRAGEIILAGEQKERAYFSIDLPDLSGRSPSTR